MACNPKWKEIVENLRKNESTIDRPDLIVKIFHQKVNILLEELVKKGIFSKCIAYTYVIEFQKRGLPHMHMLLFVDPNNKVYDADDADKVICAEIPDQIKNPRLFSIVKQFMIHGPCGKYNMNSPYMDSEKQKCLKNFPKAFNEETNSNTNR